MEKIFFITDLDRTIIHSKNRGYKVVEKIGEKEITYMTEKSYLDFLKLLKNKNFNFIPCTMRNLKQTLRVDFIKNYNPKFIICSNGAEIYIDGKLDEFWDKRMKVIKSNDEVIREIEYIESLNLNYKEIRNIEGFYITIKANNEEEAEKIALLLKDNFKKSIRIIQIGIKVFLIDERINKVNAVDYLIENYNIENLFTAGDSEVDKEFTKRGKALLPNHSSFKHNSAFITKKTGIYSTEEIIEYLNGIC